MRNDLPVLGICGWSGSGKTTLIEAALPRLRARGLSVAVVKHDAHGLQVDRPGKDSDRLFRAGADVLVQGPGEEFLRSHRGDEPELAAALQALAERYDLVLVEGHKRTPLPKLWLLGRGQEQPPPDARGILTTLPWDSNRVDLLTGCLDGWLRRQWRKTPLLGCILMGGKSSRMGRPKHLLKQNGKTWAQQTVAVLAELTQDVILAGRGAVPRALESRTRLADAPDVSGPLAGILAAMRWAPRASWLVAACDLPDLSAEALRWLASFRAPGIWAALPRLEGSGGVEPLLAYYDFRARPLLEQIAAAGSFRPADITRSPKVVTPIPPRTLAPAWRNINTQADLRGSPHLVDLPTPEHIS